MQLFFIQLIHANFFSAAVWGYYYHNSRYRQICIVKIYLTLRKTEQADGIEYIDV